jgi:phage terminase small subunit
MENKTPAPRALAALDLPTPVLPDKPLPVTPKVRRAILLFVNGDCQTITQAAQRAGLARESLSKALDRPHVIAYLQQRTRKRLEILAARAGVVKGELLDSDSEIVRDRASSFVLGLAGIQPAATPTVSLNLEIRAGYRAREGAIMSAGT